MNVTGCEANGGVWFRLLRRWCTVIIYR